MKFLNYLLLLLFVCTSANAEVIFDWAHIGNPGNTGELSDGSGVIRFAGPSRGPSAIVGSVNYNYRISKTEVTNAQYAEFLNSVAQDDPHELYIEGMGFSPRGGIERSGSPGNYSYTVKTPVKYIGTDGIEYVYFYENKPVVYVSFFDAIRFTNWLHNGKGNGSTETGAYTIDDENDERRNENAKYWIPSEDEWYKAAYYDPNQNSYFQYATGSNITPNNNLSSVDTGNSVNFSFSTAPTGTISYPFSDVGSYSLTKSPYGTLDQNGNVSEWNDSIIESNNRGVRGTAWDDHTLRLSVNDRKMLNPNAKRNSVGFRVASIAVPEPSSAILLTSTFGIVGFAHRR